MFCAGASSVSPRIAYAAMPATPFSRPEARMISIPNRSAFDERSSRTAQRAPPVLAFIVLANVVCAAAAVSAGRDTNEDAKIPPAGGSGVSTNGPHNSGSARGSCGSASSRKANAARTPLFHAIPHAT